MHILLAVDGSKGSQQAIDTVAATHFPESTHVTLVHVVTRYIPPETALPKSIATSRRDDEDRHAEAILDDATSRLKKDHLTVDVQRVEGHPAEQIIDAALALKADLIVMGALGVTGWIRVLLGSISTTVVKHSPCPVWVVKRPVKTRRMDVLIASDGSENARLAIQTACSLPYPSGTVCHLLHVVPSVNEALQLTGPQADPPVLSPMFSLGEHHRQHGDRVIKEDTETLAPYFSEVRPAIVEGDCRKRIIEVAREVEADLIVMGSKGLSGIREFLIGSVSHKVLKHTESSVLISPPAPHS